MAEYDEDDCVCVECIKDDALRALVNAEGSKDGCALCGEENICVSIRALAEIIDPVFRANFAHGEMVREIGQGDDDTVYDVQQGEDLNSSLQILLGEAFEYDDDLYDAIISALSDGEDWNPGDGDEPFYDETLNYEETSATAIGPSLRWDEIGNELKTRRRFFSDSAKEFFEELFRNVEQLSGREVNQADVFSTAPQPTPRKAVVQEWSSGTVVFRARRGDRPGLVEDLLREPKVELAPPSPGVAKAGRMNPEGVAVFYGALEVETCLAEMRSSIGSTIVVAQFETKEPLRILDFRLLERAWGHKPLSYFQSDFQSQVEVREFLRKIHHLISQPIVPGHESEYLITQVLAEYLAHVRREKFDGLLFSSTQRISGTNVVLFPKSGEFDVEKPLNLFRLKYTKDTVNLYRTKGIEYSNEKLRYFEGKNGDIHFYSDHDYDN